MKDSNKSYAFVPLAIRLESILVDTPAGVTAVARYNDERGVYFLDAELKKRYTYPLEAEKNHLNYLWKKATRGWKNFCINYIDPVDGYSDYVAVNVENIEEAEKLGKLKFKGLFLYVEPI